MSDLQQPYDAVLAESTTSGSTMACSTGYCQCAAKDDRIAELEAKCLGLAGQSAERGNRMVEMRQRIAELEAEVKRLEREYSRYYKLATRRRKALQVAGRTIQANRLCELENREMARRMKELEAEVERFRNLWADTVRSGHEAGAVAQKQITELEAEAAGLREDRERLDWMEAQMLKADCWLPGYNRRTKTWFVADESENEPTFRAALDVAREEGRNRE